ncbi:sodium:solute symporter family protein [Natronorarus salvus]|uniref:sodium:solute symporter family protein n=1 Tax=Natronorarus salvus TaxID=3117733 RepID=UPI002F263F66
MTEPVVAVGLHPLQFGLGEDVNPVYLGLFVVYLLAILAIGLWGYLRTEDIDDFWVFGKELGPVLATWSLVATFVSSVSVIGFIGAVYADGYAIMTGIIFGLMLGVSAFYFATPYVRELDLVTFPDIMAEVTGIQATRPVAGGILLLEAWLYIIMQLLGAALLVTAITGVPFEYMVWVIGAVFIAYTALGGLVSVAWTDLAQGVLMVATVFVAFFYMIYDLGSLTAINEQFAAIDPAFVDPTGDGAFTLTFLLATQLAFFGTIFTVQSIIIRVNATTDVRTAKLHVAWGGVILSVFYAALIMLGGATTVALEDAGLAADPVDMAFPLLITEYLPTAVGSVIIVAVMSAILSTTDQSLHAAGITTANDIYDYFADDASQERLFGVSRIATVVAGITAILATVDPPGTIIYIYEFRAVLLTAALFIPVYAGLWKRELFTGRALATSMLLGGIGSVAWQLLDDPLGIPAVFAGGGLAVAALIVVTIIERNTD